jgi:hypothetical protein
MAGFIKQYPVGAAVLGLLLLAPVLAVMLPDSTRHVGSTPQTSVPTDTKPTEEGIRRDAAEVTALLNLKETLRSSGAMPLYMDAVELDERIKSRVLVKVTPAFMNLPKHAKDQFAQRVESVWGDLRGQAGATEGRSLLLMVGPTGTRIGGSTVTGLAEVDE